MTFSVLMNEIILKFYEAHVITSGRLEGVLNGLQYNLAWEVREVISEIMERLLFKRFHCKTRLERLSNELQDATFNDPYRTMSVLGAPFYLNIFLSNLKLTNREFEVKSNVMFFTRSNFFHCEIYILL